MRLHAAGARRLGVQRMSNSANSIWRSVCMPLWKLRAASMRSNSARGSGAPVSTWAVMRCSTSHSQQKFSMNWLGSSTASHSTPLMPDTPARHLRQHVVQAVAELVEQGDHVVVRQQRRLVAHGRGEVAHQVRHGRLQAASGRRAASGCARRPSRRRTLAAARAGVQVELAAAAMAGPAVALDAVEAHAVVPHRRRVGRMATLEQRLDDLNRPSSTLGSVKYCLTSCSLKA
jgi:hypothetical protein